MPARRDVSGFIRSTFRSAWALEVLCLLRKAPDRTWSRAELVATLRASDLVIDQSLTSLAAAGLVAILGADEVKYEPASASLDALARDAEAQYASSPAKVRRLIVTGDDSLSAFADAFRLRKD